MEGRADSAQRSAGAQPRAPEGRATIRPKNTQRRQAGAGSALPQRVHHRIQFAILLVDSAMQDIQSR